MPSRAAAAQSASGRDSSITQPSSSQLSSRDSVSSNMGRRCAHDGCNRLTLTGGPKCHSHTTKPQSSPPIRGSAQIRGTDSLSPANSQMNNESTSSGRPETMFPAEAGNGPSRRTGESQNPPHPAKGLSHKSLPAKATARKSIPKPGQRREDSNSAAADEAEIVVASKPTTSTNRTKAPKRTHDNLLDSPRKKQRLGLWNAAAGSEEPRPLTNGATHKVPARRPELPTSRPAPQPAPTTTTAAVSSTSLTAALTDKKDEQSRSESRGREAPPPQTHVSLDASWHGKSGEGKAKKKMSRITSVAEHASEKLKAGPTAASIFHPRERIPEREKSNTEAPTQEHPFKTSGQGITSSSTVEPNKGETNIGHPVVLSPLKSPLGPNAVDSSRSTESSWQSTVLAPGLGVKKPRWTSFVGGPIGHKPTAQSHTAYSSHAPLAIQPGLKGLRPGPVAEATQHAPPTSMVSNTTGETQILRPAIDPIPTTKLQVPERQRTASFEIKTKLRTDKAKSKTPSMETAAGQVPTPAPQLSGVSCRPGVSTVAASSSTDRLKFWDIVQDTIRPVLRASSFSAQEPPPIPRDAASSARTQIASSQPVPSQERRPNAKNNHGQQPPAAPRQPVFFEQSMRNTEILSHVSEKTKNAMKAPVGVQEDSRGSQRHQPLLTSSQRKETAFKMQSGYSEHSSALPQRPKGQGLFHQDVVSPPKNNRTGYQAPNLPEKAKWPTTSGVAATAKLDTTGAQLRKEGNSVIPEQPPQNPPPVIDLVSSDSDSPAPPRPKPKTILKTQPPITESQEAQPGLRMPSVTIGPIPTLTGVPSKPSPSANGLGESWQMRENPLAIGVPTPTSLEGKTHIPPKPSTSSELVATGLGSKTSDSDKPLLSPSRRWTNVTPKRWKALPLSQRKQMLQDQHDECRFDGFIYGPANAPNHPQPSARGKASVEASTVPKTTPANYFRHFDPRVHWTHSRPKEWHERKQKEIADRGNRKAPQNFGQAAARRAKLKASARPRKVDLPERVERNPKWVAALAELDDMAKSYHEAQRTKARLRKKRQKAAKDHEGDTEMQDAPLETSESTKEAPIIGGMRRPLLEVMMDRRWQ